MKESREGLALKQSSLSANQTSLSRRAALRLLGAAVLATVAGCRPSKKSDATPPVTPASGSPSRSASVAPSHALAARVADGERELIAAYDAAIAAVPELAPQLAPLRADHAAHLVGLAPGAATAPASSGPTSATPTPPPSLTNPSGSTPSSPGQSLRAETLVALAAREKAAAAARVDDLMSADGSLARLLASIGGCEAAHAALLTAAS